MMKNLILINHFIIVFLNHNYSKPLNDCHVVGIIHTHVKFPSHYLVLYGGKDMENQFTTK